ncbi:unnamed protein product [Microthlaspi erraticum]|uniref:Uncharacterized protein n=1 Tax=Microthlaspi erraticum TaxID=1685480 RepID=A0A6D2JSR4_9BRAS|nr:unnamed protein product [Microthlaspi erraticum]
MQRGYSPYAGHLGDDFEYESWGRSHGFHQPTPSAPQGYHHHGFSAQSPSHVPFTQDNELKSMLQQLLQGQADCAFEINQPLDQMSTIFDAWESPQEYASQDYHHHGFSTQDSSHDPSDQDNELKSMLQQLLKGQDDYALEMNQQMDPLISKLDAWVSPQENTESIASTSRPEGTLPTQQDMDPKECYNEWSVDNTIQEEQEDAYDTVEPEFELELEHLFLEVDDAYTSPKIQHTSLNVDIEELKERGEQKFSEMRVVNNEKREAPFEKKEYLYVPPPYEPYFLFAGLISPNEVSLEDPMKLSFEAIRMKEFRGWFYDEYDPGDPRLQ